MPSVTGMGTIAPTLIANTMPTILNYAAGVGQTPGNNWGATTATALGVATLVTTAINEIPRDTTSIGTIVNAGQSAIGSSLLPAFDPSNPSVPSQETAFIGASGLVSATLTSTAANNNVPVIQQLLSTFTNGYGLSLVPANGGLTALDQVLNASVTALGSATLNNQTMGALTEGALLSQGANASAIASRLQAASLGTATYTNAVVAGYSSVFGQGGIAALNAYKAAVTANPGYADAVASGAILTGTVSAANIVQYALTNETGTPPVAPGPETHSADIIAAILGASQANGANIVTGAINVHTPYGAATFGDIAWAIGKAAPLTSIGNYIQQITGAVGLVANNAGSISTLKSIVNQAIVGAAAGSNTDADADIVYKAQSVAKSVAGMSDPLVRQAINSMGAANSFIAVVAALAGDANNNRTTITNAAYAPVTGEMTRTGGPGGDVIAATDGATLVANIQANIYNAFVTSLNAYVASQSHGSPTNSTIADLYAAVLTDPNEADSGLALAIKQSSGVPVSTLIEAAMSADHVTNPSGSQDVGLSMVASVANHIKNELICRWRGHGLVRLRRTSDRACPVADR